MKEKNNLSKAKKFGEKIVQYRWPVLIASLLLAFGLSTGMDKLAFDGDYHVFFSKENPELLAFDELQDKYSKDDNVFIVLSPKDGKVFTKETLTAIAELTAEAWNTPFSSRVDAITNYQHTRAVEDDLYVEDLVLDPSALNDARLKEVKSIALQEPLLLNRLVNKKGNVTAVNITVRLPGEELTEVPEVSAAVREMMAKWEEKYPEIDTYMSGMVMMNTSFFEASINDTMTLYPLMILMVLLTVLLLTRSISSTFITLIIILLSICSAMGVAGYLGIKLTPPSATAPIIILTLAVADSIHIIVTMLQGMRNGLGKIEALIESIRMNFMPVFITSLTTVIGFLSMNFGDVPPFWDLGNITAIGMTMAFIYSVTLLPALLAILPVKAKVRKSKKFQLAWYEEFGKYVSQRPKKMAIFSTITIALLSILAVQNEFNDEFVKYFDKSVKFRTDTDFISDNLTGIYNVEFSVPASESGGINNPEYLKNLDRFDQWLKQQDEVIHVNSFTEVAKRINKSMHGDSLQYYTIPTSREEAAQYLLLYEMSLPFGLDLNNQINVDKSETRLTATVENLTSADLIAFSKKAEDWLSSNTPKYMHATPTSPTLMFSNLGFRQADSMFKGNVIALILISIIMMFALRSFKFGLLSLIPNVTPVIVGFGIWAMINGQINTGMVIVFGMTLGIIVDDTVHFMTKFLRSRREHGTSAEEAVQYAFKTVGKAIVTTTIVLLVGFGILSQSSFGLNNGMARISTVIIFAALVIDFILLPSLLILATKDKASAVSIKADSNKK